jgi:hypothetical protein
MDHTRYGGFNPHNLETNSYSHATEVGAPKACMETEITAWIDEGSLLFCTERFRGWSKSKLFEVDLGLRMDVQRC